jgi:hypothetical protein
VTDLHRHFIDHLTIPSQQGKGLLRRVDEVFDCWFESGSMPYGQLHYPFENKELFEANFPAGGPGLVKVWWSWCVWGGAGGGGVPVAAGAHSAPLARPQAPRPSTPGPLAL